MGHTVCPTTTTTTTTTIASDAIIEFLDYVYSSLDSKQNTIAIYLDFSKAFDTVNHNILMSKLLHSGVRGIMQHWFKSYLSNRKQYVYVSIKNCNSSMSPVLFILYIHDIYRSSNQMRFVHFADDTTVFLHPRVTLRISVILWIGNWYVLLTGSRPTDFLSTLVKLHIW